MKERIVSEISEFIMPVIRSINEKQKASKKNLRTIS